MNSDIFYKIICINIIVCIFLYGCASNNVNLVAQQNIKTIVFAEFNTDLSATSDYGQHFINGANLALNEINAGGGINGKKLLIKHYDDYLDYFKSKERMHNLKNSDTIAAFGTFFSQPSSGVASGAEEYGIPFLSSSYTDANIYKHPNNYTYRLRPGLKAMLKSLAVYANKIGNLNRWLIITYSNTESKEAAKFFEKTLTNLSHISNNKASQNFMFNYIYTSPFKANQYIHDNVLKDGLSISKAVLIITNGNDLQSLIDNKGLKQKLANKVVFAPFAGEPEWLQYTSNTLTPENNWIVTVYPWYSSISNEHNIFYRKYYNTYSLQPRYASLLGYLSIYMLANTAMKINFHNDITQIRKDFNKELSKIVLNKSPIGSIYFRNDHISSIGVFSGILRIFSERVVGRSGRGMLLKDIRMNETNYLDINKTASFSEEEGVINRNINIEKNQELKQYNIKFYKIRERNLINSN